ncbi:FixH family protein [Chitinibacter tainanensis]|uniref:FixH family protein n=1 Tax=Chitinibacter tainanensis TaxID=230667 RepID=UPI000427CB8A|nr:FixH family protein [Chitinibacter tainanensis]
MEEDVKPWYNYGHVWLLILFPVLAILGGILMIYLVNTNQDSLVSDSYYKEGQQINQKLALDQQAGQLGLGAQVLLSDNLQQVRVIMNQAVAGDLVLQVSHPTRTGLDQQITLKPQGGNLFAGSLPRALLAERWVFELSDQQKHWRLEKQWQVLPGEPLELKASK